MTVDVSASRRPGEEGSSLAELLVGIMLMGIVGVLLTSVFSAAINTTLRTSARTTDTNTLNIALATTTKALRTADDPDEALLLPRFQGAAANEVTFFAAVGNRGTVAAAGRYNDTLPARVRFTYDATTRQLLEQVTPGVTLANGNLAYTGTPRTRVLAEDVVAGSAPIFSYFFLSTPAAPGAPQTEQQMTPPTGASLSAADRDRISSVEVRLTVQSTPSRRTTSTTSLARVTLLN